MIRKLLILIFCLTLVNCYTVNKPKKLSSAQFLKNEKSLNEANILIERKKYEEALVHVKKVLSFDWNHKEAQSMRKEIKRAIKKRNENIGKSRTRRKVTFPFIDSGVSGIVLQNAKTAERVLGESINKRIEKGEFQKVLSYNLTEDEVLTSVFNPKGTKNAVVEFEVAYAGYPIKTDVLNIAHFITGKGVKLGMDYNALIKILGRPTGKRKIDGLVIFDYTTDDRAGEPYWLYYGNYFFEDKKLVKMKFGYENQNPDL
jgi:hypothetical protein